MQNEECIIRRKSDYQTDVSLEKFKKMAFEIIERKDKLISMLYGILEMVGVTSLSIKEIMSRYSNTSKRELIESGMNRLMADKNNISPRKRLGLDEPINRSAKKKRILNIFSTPQNIYEPLHNDKNVDAEVMNLDEKLSSSQKEINNCQHETNNFSKIKNIEEPEREPTHPKELQKREKKELKQKEIEQKEIELKKLQQQLIDARNGNLYSARKHNISLKRSEIEYRIRARENLKVQGCLSEFSDENSDTEKTLNSEINESSVESTVEEEKKEEQTEEKKKEKNKEKNKEKKKKKKETKEETEEENKETEEETEEETCYVCLMPMQESLIGSFPPSQFKLRCGHVFHLKCLYEMVRRRNIRQTCCTCQEILHEKDKTSIIEKIKIEKKEHDKRNKTLVTMLRMQAIEK